MSERRFPRWAEAFIPTKEVAFTPVVISVNVLIWLIMVATGSDPLAPDIEDVRAWGANEREAIAAGEYWRLWTSNYLHYGALHLAVNMLSLNNVGRLLERFIGTWRFALLYTITGIFACTISIWWNPFAVGVGASGAILGIVGVLAALLTTNLIDRTIRMQMLRSIAYSIGLMLVLGFMIKGVDNAAHIGGMLAGAVGGYLIYPELKAFYYQRRKQYWGLIGALLIIAGASGVFVMISIAESPVTLWGEGQRLELTAEDNFSTITFKSGEEVHRHVISRYDSAAAIYKAMLSEGFNDSAMKEVDEHLQFIEARIKYLEYFAKGVDTKDPIYNDSIEYWGKKSMELRPIILDPTK